MTIIFFFRNFAPIYCVNMKKCLCLLLAIVLLATSSIQLWAEEGLPADIKAMSDNVYRYYSLRQTDDFFAAVKAVKTATENTAYEETYYKVSSYEALYMFEYVNRKNGVQMAHDIYQHANDHNSNTGMYYAIFTLGSVRNMSGNYELAEKSFLQAIELKKRYFPSESAAPCYLGLCEIGLKQKDYDKVQINARKALDEPNVIPMNQITAWTYKCLVRYNQGDSLGFEQAFKEREQLVNQYGGQGGTFGELLNVYQAKNRRQWQLALQRTDKLIHLQNKCAQKAEIYEHMGNLRQALYWQKRTREVFDSIQSAEVRTQMTEFDTELAISSAENEAKDLLLANNRLLLTAGGIIAVMVIAFMSIFAYRRKKQMNKLQSVNRQLQEAYDKLEETTKIKERMESELRIAREIQKRMLPHVFPKRKDIDLYAMMTPAKEVGGDLYGYAFIDEQLYFCVGDVSGKGVPAALFMAEVTRMFRTLIEGRLAPDVIAARLNHALAEDNDQGMFVTMFIGLIDLKTGHMEFCNAGHNPPLLDGEFMKMAIGLCPEADFEGEEVANMHGKTLFVYTDGINEAENKMQEQFGDHRLKALLQHDLGDARQTSEMVHKAVENFVGDAEPSDDLTKMCIKMK